MNMGNGASVLRWLHSLGRKFDGDWGWNLARLLAYTFLTQLFAVLGLVLVVLALVLRTFGPTVDQDDVAFLAAFLPNHTATTAMLTFAQSLVATPVILLVLGLPVALWYGSRFFVVLESCLCVIFRRPRRSFLRQNRMALGMLALFVVLLPVILVSVTLTPHLLATPIAVSSAAHQHGPAALLAALRASPQWTALGVLAGLAANFALLLVAYTQITPGRVGLRAAWPGALLAASLAQGYLLIFPLYTRYILQPDHFGAIAGFALVSLMFFFAYGFLIIIGAEVASWQAGYREEPREITAALAHLHSLRSVSRPLATPTPTTAPTESAEAIMPRMPVRE
ncbi:MAG TPA: YhjD/YihY/BrkB family envelope integrity protein [Ktedonobacterales bacterium]|nr:YhjD/YihY/BrkB family envelope integrity protein [Ktedonobacterales bacterium]